MLNILMEKNLRKKACKALERVYWQPQTDEEKVWFSLAQGLFAAYKDPHWSDLCEMGEVAIAPIAMIFQEYEDDYFFQRNACETLGKIGTPKARKILLDVLAGHRTKAWDNAAMALAELQEEAAVPNLISAGNKGNLIAIYSLGKIANAPAKAALINVLKAAQSPEVRACAALQLGIIRDPLALEALLLALEDHGFYLEAVQDMLGGYHGANGRYVRAEAALALGALGDRRAIEALRKMETDDPVPEVRTAAGKALQGIERA